MRKLFGVVVRLLATSSSSNRLLYEHGYHAGNYADVVKHSVLVQLLDHMCKKKSPFVYVETHSGAGGYALTSTESLQLAEHEQGISMFLNRHGNVGELHHPATQKLLDIMERVSSSEGFPKEEIIYPGSPMIALELCRDQDSLLFCEKEEEQFELLQSRLRNSQPVGHDDRIVLLQENGYKALKRFENLQANKRGLVFIDPPYQMGSDSEQIASLVGFLQRHWRSARVAIWHPVSRKNREKADRLYELVMNQVEDKSATELLATELYDDAMDDVVGTGMLLVNPPYGIDQEIESLYASLGRTLSGGSGNPQIMIQRL